MSSYADTSFVASLYIPDANSAEAARRMRRLSLPVLITPLGELELINAVQLRLFRKEVRPGEARAANAAFRADLHEGVFAVRALSEDVFGYATRLASRWTARLGARSLDIIHVAAAIALRADAFYTFDDRQRKLAKAAKLHKAKSCSLPKSRDELVDSSQDGGWAAGGRSPPPVNPLAPVMPWSLALTSVTPTPAPRASPFMASRVTDTRHRRVCRLL